MATPKQVIGAGRVDQLAEALLKAGLKQYADQPVRVLMKMLEGPMSQALRESIGPGTPVGDAAVKAIEAAREFQRRYNEAAAKIRAEGFET